MQKPVLRARTLTTFLVIAWAVLAVAPTASAQTSTTDEAACKALMGVPNVTVIMAELKAATDKTPQYCYVKALVSGTIQFHVQLPLPASWNGRYISWGDGGKDGDLDFADARLAQGYAVSNSNMGHDNGAEPGSSGGFNTRQAEIDFGYRAVHVSTVAAKTIVKAF